MRHIHHHRDTFVALSFTTHVVVAVSDFHLTHPFHRSVRYFPVHGLHSVHHSHGTGKDGDIQCNRRMLRETWHSPVNKEDPHSVHARVVDVEDAAAGDEEEEEGRKSKE